MLVCVRACVFVLFLTGVDAVVGAHPELQEEIDTELGAHPVRSFLASFCVFRPLIAIHFNHLLFIIVEI